MDADRDQSNHRSTPNPSIGRQVAEVLGTAPVAWEPVTRHGATNNLRWRARLADGDSVFVKAAIDAQTADWLRTEYRVYSHLHMSFVPRLVGWVDDDLPALILEDLTDAVWPPPWSLEQVEAVRATLADVAATSPPPGMPPLEDMRDTLSGWHRVAENPEPFLSLQLCSGKWLDESLPWLLAASESAVLAGDALVHLDVRSDNLCLRAARALLIDWNHAVIGNPEVDVVSWLPSLHAEGGPQPEEILSNCEPLAALFTGYWASRAGLPPIPGAPRARALQLMQLRVALPWTARALRLPEPDAGG